MTPRRLFALGLVAAWSGVASAQAVEPLAASAPSATAMHPYTRNPAHTGKSPSALSLALGYEPSRTLRVESADGVDQEVETRRRVTAGAAWLGKLGQDLRGALIADGTFVSAGDDDDGGETGDGPTYSSRYLGLKLAMPLWSGFVVGVVLHAAQYDVPRLQFEDGVASDTRGRVFGAGGGILLGTKPETSIGVFHLPSMRGGSEAEGENRLLARPAVTGVDAALAVSSTKTVGLGFRRHEADEGVDADPGLAEDGGLRRLYEMLVGLQAKLGSTAFYRLGLTREVSEAAFGETYATRLKASIGTAKDSVESSIGVSGRLGFASEEAETGNEVDASLPVSDVTLLGMLSLAL